MKRNHSILVTLTGVCCLLSSVSTVQANWTAQNVPSSQNLRDITFMNPDTGWAVGDQGTVLRTTDGGVHWNTRGSDDPMAAYTGISHYDYDHGVLCGYYSGVRHTEDGDSTWIFEQADTTAYYNKVQYLDSLHAFAFGYRIVDLDAAAYVVKTSDGWQTTELKTMHGDSLFPSLHFMNGLMLDTDNGFGVGFAYDTTGWMRGQIYRTHDGWDTFETVYSNDEAGVSVNSITFPTPELGFAACNFGRILRTTDGGDTWEMYDLGVPTMMHDICFVDSLYGWAVGDAGFLYHTTDGGNTWGPQLSSTQERLYSIYFVDRQQGWISASNGLILTTTNGGGDINNPPGNFSLTSPADSLHLKRSSIPFTWTQSIDPDGDAVSYQIHLNSRLAAIDTILDAQTNHLTVDFSDWDLPQDTVRLSWNVMAFDTHGHNLISTNGTWVIFLDPEVIDGVAEDAATPVTYALHDAYPNPFNPSTTLSFSLATVSDVQLEVRDLLGRKVCTLLQGSLSAGEHSVVWNGRDHAGSQVASGTYIVRMTARHGSADVYTSVRRITLLK